MVVLEGKRSRKFGQHFAVGHLGSRVEPSRGRHGAEVSSQDQVSVHLQQQPLIEPNGPKGRARVRGAAGAGRKARGRRASGAYGGGAAHLACSSSALAADARACALAAATEPPNCCGGAKMYVPRWRGIVVGARGDGGASAAPRHWRP